MNDNDKRTGWGKGLWIAARAGAGVVAVAVASIASAQVNPPGAPPGAPPFDPRDRGPHLSGCVDAGGLALPMVMDLNFAAASPDPFSIAVTWVGPPATYKITGGSMEATVGTNAPVLAIDPGTVFSPGMRRDPSGGRVVAEPSTPPSNVNGSHLFSRPAAPVLPDFDYRFKIMATLPDGRILCDMASVKTQPAPIQALPSSFFSPDDVRVGFVMPPWVNELNIYRKAYVEDGRQPPFDKRLYQEVVQSPSAAPVSFGASGKKMRMDNRKRVSPGVPPIPGDYARPPFYDFVVEAIWRNLTQVTSTQTAIRVDGPLPLIGWADLHTHPMSHLAFGGKIFHGAPDGGPGGGSLLPALSVPNNTNIAGVPVPWGCVVQPGRRAANISEALGDDSPTHGDPAQSQCGNVLRKIMIVALEKDHGLPQPGKRFGAPVFDAWPVWNDNTHQKMWIDWIRRAYDGGLRVMVALSHNNRLLGTLARANSCDFGPCLPVDDLASSDLQVMEIKAFVARNSSFMEVALTPADLYRIVRGIPSLNVPPKIAVVLGAEIDNIGNFPPNSPPAPKAITDELARLYKQGVRYIFPVHVSDNLFGGTAPYHQLFNASNVFETGRFWQVECAGTQPYPDDEIGFSTPNVTALDELNKWIPRPFNDLVPKNVELPKTPSNCAQGPHRNSKGLNYTKFAVGPPAKPDIGVGEFAIKEMMRLGMIIDVDHMSHRTVEDVIGIAERVQGGGYPLMSGHGAIRDRNNFNAENSRTRSQLNRIGCLGGMFGLGTDHAQARTWAMNYADALQVISHRTPPCLYKEIGAGAVALGTDINTMIETPAPPEDQQDRLVNIYTTGITNAQGTLVTRFPTSGSSQGPINWNFNSQGVVHYGMFADFIKAVWLLPLNRNRNMLVSGQELVEKNLDRSADNFWRAWVKVEQQKNNVRY